MYFFERLIRFKCLDGNTYYGEAPKGSNGIDLIGKDIVFCKNDPLADEDALEKPTEEEKKVAKLLSPLPRAAQIYGVGLNYKGHAEEAGVSSKSKSWLYLLAVKRSSEHF